MQIAKRIIIQLLIISLCVCISFEYTQTTNCELHKFQCHNGECIINELLCDGTAHCKDASDETEAECAKILCLVYAFQCNYGACIHEDSVCNGVQDCIDNSDETQPQCMTTSNRTTQPIQTPHLIVRRDTRCTAPMQPQNGYWKLYQSQCPNEQECNVQEGTEVELRSHIVYSCNAGYKLQGRKHVYCTRTGWSAAPVCIEIRCRALSTTSIEATCEYNDQLVSCESSVLPGTRASLACRNRYQREPSELPKDQVLCNANGQWEPEPMRCFPVCGILPAEVTSNITDLPWYVSLYHKNEYLRLTEFYCGASIIGENLLITLASCVYYELHKQLMKGDHIYVLTGNHYEQYLSVNTSFIPNQVKNIYTTYEGNFVNDIAILEVVESFTFSSKLVPICIDFRTFSDQSLLEADGKVPVTFRENIAVTTVRYTSLSQCLFQNHTDQYIRDKFCVGYTNDSSLLFCELFAIEFSGSGLVVETNGVWYLRGIIGNKRDKTFRRKNDDCENEYSICTQITSHINWIENVLTRLGQLPTPSQSILSLPTQPTSHPVTSSIRICRAPSQPQNGHWKLPSNHSLQCSSEQDCDVPEGTQLEIGSYLVYSCNAGYEMKGSTLVSCNNEGKWLNIPICTEIRCRALSTVSTEARCTYDGEWVSCESPVLPRTMATLTCRNSYQREPSIFARNQARCNASGEWEPEPIRCAPVCGKLPADLTPLIINGVTPNITEFPWHASMYYDEPGEPKKYFCGASIIQDNLLITAAHCVYDESTKRVTDKTIYIVTGNIFRNYDFPWHDARLVRKNQVKHIYITCDYLGLVGNYVSDIAILKLVEPFVLSTWLVPVCIDPLSDLTVLEAGAYGKVAGFGITASGETSGVLQALTVPYVPYNQCKSASQNVNTEEYITADKFCAGYSNGSSVCDGDSGGGLVFKRNSLWYLRGIVSVSLGTRIIGATARCDNNFYSLYTRVSNHMEWIQDVMAKLKQNQTYPSCQERISY